MTVGDVAKLTGVSVRTLHHYDQIGLLRPSSRSPSGYRLYTTADLERLQEILFFRELGFDLDGIGRILAAPDHSRADALARQRDLLVERIARLNHVLQLVDRSIDAIQRGNAMTTEQLFSDYDAAALETEAEARWGETEAFRESKRRTKSYDKATFAAIQAEADAIVDALADTLRAGLPASSEAAMELAERYRLHIDRWFYPCSHAMHRSLGEMYVADPRFTAYYDQRQPGLAAHVRDAIAANADRQGA